MGDILFLVIGRYENADAGVPVLKVFGIFAGLFGPDEDVFDLLGVLQAHLEILLGVC